jgi:hypothetical protein
MAQRRSEWADPTQTRAFAALAELLWTEREALEQLLCKIVVGQLVVHAAANAPANAPTNATSGTDDGEVDLILQRLRLTEVLRAAEVEELARASRLPLDVTLGRLAEVAPEPWTTVLGDHEAALEKLLADLEGFAGVRQLSLREFLG